MAPDDEMGDPCLRQPQVGVSVEEAVAVHGGDEDAFARLGIMGGLQCIEMAAEYRGERILGEGPPVRSEREVVRRTLMHAKESTRGPNPESPPFG